MQEASPRLSGIEPESLASPSMAGRPFTATTTWKAPPQYSPKINSNIHFIKDILP